MDGDTIKTKQSGGWSDPDTWEGGIVPDCDHDVEILHDLVIDADAACCELNQRARVILGGQIELCGSWVVWSGAVLEGAEGTISFLVADDRLFTGNTAPGPMPDMPDFHPDDIGLWVMEGGRVTLIGEFADPWFDAAETGLPVRLRNGIDRRIAIKDSKAARGEIPQGWKLGDTLLLTSETGKSSLAQLAFLSDSNIVFNNADTFSANVLIAANGKRVCPKIANLSRGIKIIAGLVKEGDTNHRAHIACMKGGVLQLENVEIRNFGPRAKLGRYPIHFHKLGDSQNYARNCAIWQDVTELGSRMIAVHASSGVEVTGNVGYRIKGHAIFMEDGSERECVISENLVVDCRGPEELTNDLTSVEINTYSFWLRPGNTFFGNVAVGGDNGFILLPNSRKVGAVQDPRRLLTDCVAMGVLKFGIQAAVEDTNFVRPVSVYAGEAGIGKASQYSVKNHDMLVEECLLLMNGILSTGGSDVHLAYTNRMVLMGGYIAGVRAAIKTPQPGQLNLIGVTIRNDIFFRPIFFRVDLTVEGGDIEITKSMCLKGDLWGWKQAIPADSLAHWLRFRGTKLRLAGIDFPDFNANYTHPHWAPNYPGKLEYFMWRADELI